MTTTHNIQDITFDRDTMILKIDGKIIVVILDKISKKLKEANDFQRQLYKISPSGYGIHWPLIDEDLSVEYILKSFY